MVGCKDDPRHKLTHLPSLHLKSPTQDEQDTRLAHWLHTVTPTLSILPHTSTSASTSNKLQDHYALDPHSTAPPHLSKLSHPPANAPSLKRKALAELEPCLPRKSARLAQRQSDSGYYMSTSPSKRRRAGKNAREGAKHGPETNEANASGSHAVTRTQAQAKTLLASSSDKENASATRDVVRTISETEDARFTIPLLQPAAVLAPPDPGSSPNRKLPFSRPTSPTKSSSTRSGRAPVLVDKRERLTLLNPPIKFFARAYLGKLGKDIQPLVRSLWVDHIASNDEGYIPQALKARIPPQTPNKSKPSIHQSCFAINTRYSRSDYERIWVMVADVIKTADECRHMGYHESHWISHVVSPMLKLVSNLKRYDEDGLHLIALDIQTVSIDPPALCSYSSDAYFKDLDKRIDCAVGLLLSEEETAILERGVYQMESAIDGINQTSSFVNFTPMFLNIEVKRKNSDKDPLIQLAAWISAEFEKRRIEHYSLDMPVLAIEIEGDSWGLYMVYADEGVVDGEGYGLKFVGPVSLGDTSSLQGCFKLLDGLCRCGDWGVGKYQSWFREEILDKYRPPSGNTAAQSECV